MSEVEVPLRPMGREDIQKLEAVLLIGTVSREDVIEKMRNGNPQDRITWIDSLAVAAGALAREKAGMTTTRIADELGRGEQTIRAHLTGKQRRGSSSEKHMKCSLKEKEYSHSLQEKRKQSRQKK